MKEEIFLKLTENKLFASADQGRLRELLESKGYAEKEYSYGETVYSNGERKLGMIIKGSAKVYSPDGEKSVLLRTLNTGDVFGIATLFGNKTEKISRICAGRACTALLIDAETVAELLETDKSFMMAYIGFLSDRVRFLNKKIMYYTCGSAERRLAVYLLSSGKESVTPVIPMNALAELLDIGRASLYRSVESLTDTGFVVREGETFIIKDRKSLCKKYGIDDN